MATTIDIATRASLGKLIRLLTSNVDGEVLGAVHALRRVLKSNGLDFNDLAKAIEVPSITPSGSNGRAETGFHRGDTVETELPWRDMVAACVRHLSRFTVDERDFIRNMNDRHGTPSAKQLGWLVALFERVRGRK